MPLQWVMTSTRAKSIYGHAASPDDYLAIAGNDWIVARVMMNSAQSHLGWQWSITGLPVPGAHYGSEADLETAKTAAEGCFRRWLSTVGLQERTMP